MAVCDAEGDAESVLLKTTFKSPRKPLKTNTNGMVADKGVSLMGLLLVQASQKPASKPLKRQRK